MFGSNVSLVEIAFLQHGVQLPIYPREKVIWNLLGEPSSPYQIVLTNIAGEPLEITIEIDGVNMYTGKSNDRMAKGIVLYDTDPPRRIELGPNLIPLRFLDVESALSKLPEAGSVRLTVFRIIGLDRCGNFERAEARPAQVTSFMYCSRQWLESQGVTVG